MAVSIGPKQCTETLRTALAMGCDRGIHIQTDLRTDYMELQPFAIAQLLQKVVEKEDPQLVLLGKQGIDSDCGQTGPLLAGFLQWPQVTFAANVQINDDNEKITCGCTYVIFLAFILLGALASQLLLSPEMLLSSTDSEESVALESSALMMIVVGKERRTPSVQREYVFQHDVVA